MKLDCDKYLGSSKVWLSLSLWVQACANESIICSMDLRMFTSRVPILSEFPCWLELVSLLNNTVKVFPRARGFHKSNVPHSTRTCKLLLAFLSLSIMMYESPFSPCRWSGMRRFVSLLPATVLRAATGQFSGSRPWRSSRFSFPCVCVDGSPRVATTVHLTWTSFLSTPPTLC